MTIIYDQVFHWDRKNAEAQEKTASAQRDAAAAQRDVAAATEEVAEEARLKREQDYWHRVVGQKVTSNGVEYIEYWQSEKGQAEIAEENRRKKFWIKVKAGIILSLLGLITVPALVGANRMNEEKPQLLQNSAISLFNSQSGIPNGKALFKSGRTGKEEVIGVSLAGRINTNGHTIYDANWSDGYKSSYAFWSNGRAEIFSKDGNGKTTSTPAVYEYLRDGSTRISTKTNTITIFPSFKPVANNPVPTMINANKPQSSKAIRSEASCWESYLSSNPGMSDWAKRHPALAAKARQKRCG